VAANGRNLENLMAARYLFEAMPPIRHPDSSSKYTTRAVHDSKYIFTNCPNDPAEPFSL
jgi:hypothetical protein